MAVAVAPAFLSLWVWVWNGKKGAGLRRWFVRGYLSGEGIPGDPGWLCFSFLLFLLLSLVLLLRRMPGKGWNTGEDGL